MPERSDALAPYRRHRFMDAERMHEECGLFGVLAPGEDVANLTYFGLYALQHRGQELAGIAVSNHRELVMHKEMELVAQVFDAEAMAPLVGDIAIGHTRYSTTGSPRLPNAQPMRFEHGQLGPLALAHNGNLINAGEVREELAADGVEFVSTSDTEVLGRLLVRTPGATLDIVLHRALPRVHGAYCLLLLTRDSLVAARDPLGIRPLCLGRFGDVDAPGGIGYIVTSETCALDVVGANFIRDIEPGEIVTIDPTGLRSIRVPVEQSRRAMCSFEFIYFARPDSVMGGQSLYEARRQMGRELAREAPADADVVITLPDSGTPAAIGFAEESGIPFAEGMIKSRYITRTFIQPSQRLREFRHPAEVQSDAPRPRGQACRPGRRLHRPRHHQQADRRRAPPRGGGRAAHAHRLAPDHVAVLHGHRHRVAQRVDRGAQDRG